MKPIMVGVVRRYVALTALRWFPTGLTVPVLVLLLTRRGLSLGAVGAVLAAYGLTAAALEVPTGGLADTIGRRPVLVAAAVLSALGTTALAVATGRWAITGALVLLGVARALDSGPLQAWFVDTVRAADPAADLKPGLARGGVASGAALALGSLAGGWLATVAPGDRSVGAGAGVGARLVDLSAPFLVAAVLTVVYGAAVALLVRDQPSVAAAGDLSTGAAAGDGAGHKVAGVVGAGDPVAGDAASGGRGDKLTGVGVTVRRAVGMTVGRGPLRRVAAVGAALGLVLAGVELLAPPAFARLLGGPSAAVGPYATLVTAGFGATAAGSALVPAAARAARSSRRALQAALVLAAGTVVGVGSGRLVPAAAAFVACYLAVGVISPLLDEATHDAVSPAERATVLSVRSSVFQLGGLVASLGVGALASAAGVVAGLVALAVGALAAALVAP